MPKSVEDGEEYPAAGTADDFRSLEQHIEAGGDPWDHPAVTAGAKQLGIKVRYWTVKRILKVVDRAAILIALLIVVSTIAAVVLSKVTSS